MKLYRFGCRVEILFVLILPVLFLGFGRVSVDAERKPGSPEKLVVSKQNPHLLETKSGEPVFLNNFTVWQLLRNGSREEIREFIGILKENKYNVLSLMILDIDLASPGRNFYGDMAFGLDEKGRPDPQKPIVTEGNDPAVAEEYDFWDHLDFVVETAEEMGMYVSLHPAWGDWFSGEYSGEPGSMTIFNAEMLINTVFGWETGIKKNKTSSGCLAATVRRFMIRRRAGKETRFMITGLFIRQWLKDWPTERTE
jgi:hypothetical protein